MALTYTTLKTTIADYLDRSDLTAMLPVFIEMAESKMKSKLRHWEMEKRAYANTVAGQRTIILPSDYLEMRHLKLNTDPVQVLEYLTPSVLNFSNTATGKPYYYTMIGNEIAFDDTPDSVYEVEMYYYAFSSLSDTNATNWILTKYPDVYIYGTLLEAEAFLMNDPRLPIWKSAFDERIALLNKESVKAQHTGSPLIMRVG